VRIARMLRIHSARPDPSDSDVTSGGYMAGLIGGPVRWFPFFHSLPSLGSHSSYLIYPSLVLSVYTTHSATHVFPSFAIRPFPMSSYFLSSRFFSRLPSSFNIATNPQFLFTSSHSHSRRKTSAAAWCRARRGASAGGVAPAWTRCWGIES
jgi:hypothetical protein